ncbi:hypothetical protein INT48_007770 [Thamnidium elegans]|uniref:Uncharacterized protein n=1 Tax=Thamnidium elegans TaxID=101142 RepID=A0A8H7VZX2_9FUNG|nr:hypothetical protein INT48_007770 [Thamnidium elegans]
MFSTINFNSSATASISSGRGSGGDTTEELLLFASYAKYFDSLQTTTSDFEKCEIYLSISTYYNQKALEESLIYRSSDEQKDVTQLVKLVLKMRDQIRQQGPNQ